MGGGDFDTGEVGDANAGRSGASDVDGGGSTVVGTDVSGDADAKAGGVKSGRSDADARSRGDVTDAEDENGGESGDDVVVGDDRPGNASVELIDQKSDNFTIWK